MCMSGGVSPAFRAARVGYQPVGNPVYEPSLHVPREYGIKTINYDAIALHLQGTELTPQRRNYDSERILDLLSNRKELSFPISSDFTIKPPSTRCYPERWTEIMKGIEHNDD